MSIALIIPNRDISILRNALTTLLPSYPIVSYPFIANPEAIKVAILWKHPKNILSQFPNLQLICSLGAGVDHILSDASLPPIIPVTRVVDEGLTQQMRKYLLMAVLSQYKDIFNFYEQKRNRQWFSDFKLDDDSTIGVMGLGVLGKDIAIHLQQIGFKVVGFSNSEKDLSNIRTYTQQNDGLTQFLKQSNILICLLPLTPQTEGMLNLSLFKKMPKNAILINVGRGKHLVEEDLVAAIKLGYIKSAMLDVFSQEPLPENHPFWDFPEIIITPHIASITNQRVAAQQIAANIQRLENGQDLLHQVDRMQGY